MVFQKPNPFPKSIYDNVAFGPRVLGMKGDLDELVERALRQRGALGRGQGQAQAERARPLRRPAAAALHRALPRRRARGDPDGRAGSALDPIATARIEDLMHELKRDYTIVIVTHNMQQAARVSDMTAFFIARGRRDERQADGRPRRVRRDRRRSSPTRPTSAPRTTSPAGSADAVGLVPGRARRARGGRSQEEGELVAPLARAARSTRSAQQDVELADEVIAFDDDDRRALPRARAGHRARCSRARRPSPSTCGSCSRCCTINLHLERMGDLCVTIAKLTKLRRTCRPTRRCSRASSEMGVRAEEMIRVALALARAARPDRGRVAASSSTS